MRKTFSLAFAKRRTELRFVIYDLMCCLQKPTLQTRSLFVFLSLIYFSNPTTQTSSTTTTTIILLCNFYYHYRHVVIAYPDSCKNVIKNNSFKLCVSYRGKISKSGKYIYTTRIVILQVQSPK